jgi:hypothetical protein
MKLLLDIPAGQSGVVQASTNLVEWTPISLPLTRASSSEFWDTNTNVFKQRFYRAVGGP